VQMSSLLSLNDKSNCLIKSDLNMLACQSCLLQLMAAAYGDALMSMHCCIKIPADCMVKPTVGAAIGSAVWKS